MKGMVMRRSSSLGLSNYLPRIIDASSMNPVSALTHQGLLRPFHRGR